MIARRVSLLIGAAVLAGACGTSPDNNGGFTGDDGGSPDSSSNPSSDSGSGSSGGPSSSGSGSGSRDSGLGGSITYFTGAHAFSTSWGPSSADFLAHIGLDYNGTKSYTTYGKIVAQFAE
jgi:hypothetical protein